MKKEFLNPPELPNWSDTFSQVVVVDGAPGRTIYVSGQVSVDANHNVVGRGDLATQAEWAFQNLAKALAQARATPEDVVRLGIYVKDYRSDQVETIRAAMRKVFTSDKLPASTWLGVQSLALEDLLIEVEATAVVE
jgi:enamine deaminase RidA (YjgF/YER057c/UK114 family)